MLLIDPKNAAAVGLAASASRRSSGTVLARWPAYATSQRPSARAASTSRWPAGRICPVAIKASAFVVLIFDHRLPGLRGVKRCSQWSSSKARFCPSIQPKQSAASSASAYDTLGSVAVVLPILSQQPAEVACSASSHARQSAAEPNACIGRSRALTPPVNHLGLTRGTAARATRSFPSLLPGRESAEHVCDVGPGGCFQSACLQEDPRGRALGIPIQP